MPLRLFAPVLAPVLVLILGLAAAAPVSAQDRDAGPRPTVILISIDGFRADYLERGVTPVLSQLAAQGATGAMKPSFPSVTFPNHYTLVTGLHPDHHGIVGNNMIDAELGSFSMRNVAAVTDRRWWDGGEPIWVTAQKAGLVTGTMFWPGSEADIRGVRPRWWTRFDKEVPGETRVDEVLNWLDQPEGDRPDLATLYFDIVDTAGHEFGPDALETNEAVNRVDGYIGRLVEGLRARGIYDRTVLVIVSDHGMAQTSPERVINLADVVDPEAVQVVYGGPANFINPVPGREAEVEAALSVPRPHLECWRKADIPARLVLGSNPRVTAWVCMAETGWLLAARPVTRVGGAHGYDNAAPEMAAIFIARGPGVAAGVRLSDLDSVDVQPFLARLLRISAPASDGRPEDTLPAMASTPEIVRPR